MALPDHRTPEPESPDTSSEIVCVRIDASAASSFTVHLHLLCATSKVFRDDLQPGTGQASPRTIDLFHEDEAVFKVYVSWLYSLEVPFPAMDGETVDYARSWELFTKAYLLGDHVLDMTFKNAIVDAIAGMMQSVNPNAASRLAPVPGRMAITALYSGTTQGSKGRLLFAELCTDRLSIRAFRASRKHYPFDFILDFAEALMSRHAGRDGQEYC
ncbi:hypothetical protein LTR37_003603 [Vermiconidia calcicola]|uniref:Uncharacterized protein n=1 Tax=Vermiconidia calcicola TaxID=1690605 RepID=A0ACC3NPG1_9PEZI|nr:hypothetical protein LTR37_003603 [Vermiconidia calcicola]